MICNCVFNATPFRPDADNRALVFPPSSLTFIPLPTLSVFLQQITGCAALPIVDYNALVLSQLAATPQLLHALHARFEADTRF